MANPALVNCGSAEGNTFAILALPAELRNKIYSYLYQFRRPILVSFGQDPASRVFKAVITLDSTIPVALFSISRQICAEAASAF
jgi:hypothetical protein